MRLDEKEGGPRLWFPVLGHKHTSLRSKLANVSEAGQGSLRTQANQL